MPNDSVKTLREIKAEADLLDIDERGAQAQRGALALGQHHQLGGQLHRRAQVQVSGFRGSGFGFRIEGIGFRIEGSGLRV